MDWNKLSAGISVAWLIILMFRLVVYSAPFASTPGGKVFMTALNIFLIIGVLMIGWILGKQLLRYTAAKTMKDTHCPQCYSKVSRDEEFCPRCGMELRRD